MIYACVLECVGRESARVMFQEGLALAGGMYSSVITHFQLCVMWSHIRRHDELVSGLKSARVAKTVVRFSYLGVILRLHFKSQV